MTKHHLTLGPSLVGKVRQIDDYVVRRDLWTVGRIHRADPNLASDQAWEWGINIPLPTLWWCVGRSPSLETAKVAFLDAWIRYYECLSPEHIALWQRQIAATSGPNRRRGLVGPIESDSPATDPS